MAAKRRAPSSGPPADQRPRAAGADLSHADRVADDVTRMPDPNLARNRGPSDQPRGERGLPGLWQPTVPLPLRYNCKDNSMIGNRRSIKSLTDVEIRDWV